MQRWSWEIAPYLPSLPDPPGQFLGLWGCFLQLCPTAQVPSRPSAPTCLFDARFNITSLKISQTQRHLALCWAKSILNYHVGLRLNLNCITLVAGIKGTVRPGNSLCAHSKCRAKILLNPLPDFKTVTEAGRTVLRISVDQYSCSYQLPRGVWFSYLPSPWWAIFPREKWVWFSFALKSRMHNPLPAKAVWKRPPGSFRDKFKLRQNSTASPQNTHTPQYTHKYSYLPLGGFSSSFFYF